MTAVTEEDRDDRDGSSASNRASAGRVVVSCRAASKTYGGVASVEALRGASFQVRRGEQVAVCGPSGSGKSTLMNILGLLDVPTSGTYELLGVDVSEIGESGRAGLRARVIGFVFQSFHLLAGRTAAENVELALVYSGTPRRRRAAVARDVLGHVGLAHRVDANVTTLSGGERQRVAIARAIAHGPELLLADEPTGNLDSRTSEQVLGVLDRLNRDDGLTQVVVTHSETLAATLGRRLHVLDGVVVEPVRHLAEPPATGH